MDHPHIHCIVPGGGLTFDTKRWISSRKKFFIPVKVLSRLFRGKFLAYLKDAHEYIRRFLMHVLPDNFVKIRHYGILSNRNRKTKLKRCKEILGVSIKQTKEKKGWQELLLELTRKDPRIYPSCRHGRLIRKELLSPKKDKCIEMKKLVA